MPGDPWFNNLRLTSREDAETAFSAYLGRLGPEASAPARPRIPPPSCTFDNYTQEQRVEWGRKGGLHTPRTKAAERYGFTPEEFRNWGAVMAKGYPSDEAAEIILRSRKAGGVP